MTADDVTIAGLSGVTDRR